MDQGSDARDRAGGGTAAAVLRRLDAANQALLIGLLAFMPLAFGVVHAWSEQVVVAAAVALVGLLAVRMAVAGRYRLGGAEPAWTWVYLPLAVFAGLAVVQLTPLPVWLVEAVSPHTVAVKGQLLGDGGTDSGRVTLSFYPAATEHHLRLILVVAAVFVAAMHILRSPQTVLRFLAAVAGIGAAVALLAAAQNITGTERIYWLVETGQRRAGPFMNYSHYSQFMNLSIGAALGLFLVRAQWIFGDRALSLRGLWAHRHDRRMHLLGVLGLGIVVAALTVVFSMSRGGILSMLIAGAFTVAAVGVSRRMGTRGWLLLPLGLLLFAATVYSGFDPVYDRLATVLRPEEAMHGRWTILQDLTVVWGMFPLLGTGLGTFEVVYPMFDSATRSSLASHAENEYAQAMTEMGVVGLACVLLVAVIAWTAWARAVRLQDQPAGAAAYGLGFGLLAVMIHSFSDFGQHLPAVGGLTAVTLAMLINMSRWRGKELSGSRRGLPAGGVGRGLAFAGLLVLLAGLLWAVRGADASRAAEVHWAEALRLERELEANDWLGGNQEFAELIGHAQAAAERQPNNVHYRYWLNFYRWQAIARLRDPETGRIVLTERTADFARRIVEELHRARQLCPTFGPTYSLAGQIEYFVLGGAEGAEHIRTGYRLAAHDPHVCLAAGRLAVREGDHETAAEILERAATLDEGLFDRAARELLNAGRADLAVRVAGQQPRRLFHLAALLDEEGHADLAQQARTRVVRVVERHKDGEELSAAMLVRAARLLHEDGEHGRAIALYRTALIRDYHRVDWRLGLARTLRDAGDVEEAMRQARLSLRLRPDMDAARSLVAELSTLTGRPAD